jgi:hypothetical protein
VKIVTLASNSAAFSICDRKETNRRPSAVIELNFFENKKLSSLRRDAVIPHNGRS